MAVLCAICRCKDMPIKIMNVGQLYHPLLGISIDVIITSAMLKNIIKLFFLLFGIFLGIDWAHSASFTPYFSDTGYNGRFVSQTVADPIVIPAGSTKEVVVTMKNTGKKNVDARRQPFCVHLYSRSKISRECFLWQRMDWQGAARPRRKRRGARRVWEFHN